MEPITLAALATFIVPFFQEAGKTLAVESVKLALEKRQDIKDKFVSLIKPEEIITLGLNQEQSPEKVKALMEANPEVAKEVTRKIGASPDLLNELLEIIKEQAGKDSSRMTFNAKNIAAAGNVKIKNQKNTFS